MKREDINARMAELSDEIQTLAAVEELTDEQRSAWDAATAEFDQLKARAQDIAEREERAAQAASIPALQIINKPSTEDVLNDRSASGQDFVDAVTRSLEDRGAGADGLAHARTVMVRHRDDTVWAQKLATRSTDLYSQAFAKMLRGQQDVMSIEERTSLAVGTSADGGYLVPTHLDPTLIVTNTGSSNVIRTLGRSETLTSGNVWNGVTSAGSSFSFDAELAEVSDDSPQFGRVSIPLYKAQGFIQASVEAVEDTNIVGQLAGIIADGRDRLEGSAFASGNGSTAPTGIVTALDANTNVEITSDTAATLALADLSEVYLAVGQRWRGNGTWLMHPTWLAAIQALGTALGASYSTNITEAFTQRLFERPVVASDDMPATVTTTALDNRIVFGDFSNYVVVDKPGGFSLHYIPPGVLQNTTSNRPDGRVGWYCYWRVGADSVNDVAFRLLQDKTSA